MILYTTRQFDLPLKKEERKQNGYSELFAFEVEDVTIVRFLIVTEIFLLLSFYEKETFSYLSLQSNLRPLSREVHSVISHREPIIFMDS